MALTKIVLDRQADLILTGATISAPKGVSASDINFSNTNGSNFGPSYNKVDTALALLWTDASTEVSIRTSADLSLTNEISEEISTEASSRTSADLSLATAISDINAADFGKTTIASGLITGTNKDFGLANEIKTGSELVYLNGLLLTVTDDYTVVGNTSQVIGTVSFLNAPQLGDKLTFAGQIIA